LLVNLFESYHDARTYEQQIVEFTTQSKTP